jgi:hypothetical protein
MIDVLIAIIAEYAQFSVTTVVIRNFSSCRHEADGKSYTQYWHFEGMDAVTGSNSTFGRSTSDQLLEVIMQ